MNAIHAMVREKQGAAILSVVSNTVLVLVKLAVGMMTGAVSILSEALHSGVDLVAALVAWYAVRKSGKPPDAHHAYGHGKIENLSAAFEALLIIVAAVWIIAEAADQFRAGHRPEMLGYGMAVMALSIGVNIVVSGRLMKVARATGSHALEADALHLRADIWTSVGVLIGLAGIEITGWFWLDPAIAVVVAAVVFHAGYELTKRSLYELTDVSLPQAEEELIAEILAAHPEVISFHKLRTRRSGSFRLIDVHIQLDRNMLLEKAHAISEEIELELEDRLAPCDVVIHLEPDESAAGAAGPGG